MRSEQAIPTLLRLGLVGLMLLTLVLPGSWIVCKGADGHVRVETAQSPCHADAECKADPSAQSVRVPQCIDYTIAQVLVRPRSSERSMVTLLPLAMLPQLWHVPPEPASSHRLDWRSSSARLSPELSHLDAVVLQV